MRVRLQYILVILLFVLTGMLCRQQPAGFVMCGHAAHSIGVGYAGCRAFDRDALVAAADPARQAFTLVALAEFTDGALSQALDQKAGARAISLFGYSASKYPAAAAASVPAFDVPPPGGVDYYIYTLGKMRI